MLSDQDKDIIKDFLNSNYTTQILNLSDDNHIIEVDISDQQILPLVLEEKNAVTELEEIILEEAQKKGIVVKEIRVKIFGIKHFIKIRELKSINIGKIVRIRGIINRASEIRPMYIVARFNCRECGQLSAAYPQHSPVLTSPVKCQYCKSRNFDISPEDSEFQDSQELRIQELPRDIPSAQTPKNVDIIIMTDDLIQTARCGDIVEIVGIARVVQIGQRGTETKYTRHYIEANNIIKKRKEPEAIELTDEDIVKIKELAQKPDIVQMLSASIAPSLYGLEDIKEGCVYLLFGGVEKKLRNIKIRGNLNILIVGDPATGKSQILGAVSTLAPLGIYTSGRGTSAAGLTAAVVRDSTNHFTLEAGVMILADRGIACIDEVDKMRAEDRVAMHEALEQQTVSIDKGDIHQTLNARTSVLAAGNPTMGKYDLYKTVKENLSNLPETFFSRFDLIFITKDMPQRESDLRMSEHVLGIHRDIPDGINNDLFQKYIAFAKRIKPKLTREAKKRLNEYYVEIRELITEGSIGITLRQLESLVRISEAHAKIRLGEEVTIDDVDIAIKIFSASIKQVGIDQREGKSTKTVAGKMEIMLSHLSFEIERNELYEIMQKEHGVTPPESKKILSKLLQDGIVLETKSGYFKRVM